MTAAPSEFYTMISLEPVWVTYPNGEKRPARNDKRGPNGEDPETGKWKLRWPEKARSLNTIQRGALMSRLPFDSDGVYNGPTLSPSAIKSASECWHSWGLGRLDDLARPSSAQADMGNDRHAELENWLKHGVAPTSSGMAQVIAHFPMPGQCESEVYFGFIFGRQGHEVVFAGYLDARESALTAYLDAVHVSRELGDHSFDIYFDENGNEVLDMPSGALVEPTRMNSTIRDLKTTGSFDWKKTAAQLRADLQACIYGLGEILRVEDARTYTDWAPATEPTNSIVKPVVKQSMFDRVEFVILKWTYALINKAGVIRKVETVCEEGSFSDGSPFGPVNGPNGGVVLTREAAIATVGTYLPIAERMFDLVVEAEKEKEKALTTGTKASGFAASLEKNANACAAYGGCAWKKPGSGLIGCDEKGENGIACDPPTGSGFKAWLKQERVRIGVVSEGADGVQARNQVRETQASERSFQGSMVSLAKRFGVEKPIASLSASTETKNKNTNVVDVKGARVMTSTSSGLGGRFGNKLNGAAPAAAAAVPVKEATKEVVKEALKEAPSPLPKTTGLGGRFAKTVDAPPTTPVVQQKATETGISASAKPTTTVTTTATTTAPGAVPGAAPGAASPTLMSRLKDVNAAKAGDVAKATQNAPTNAVTGGMGAGAVGINPPDAAPEWTPEQQAAEAARLAVKGGVQSDVAPDPKADTVPKELADPDSAAGAGAAGSTASATAVARATPRRNKKAAEEAVDQMVAAAAANAGPVTVAGALAEIDAVAVKLMKAGFRKEAIVVMKVAAEIAA